MENRRKDIWLFISHYFKREAADISYQLQNIESLIFQARIDHIDDIWSIKSGTEKHLYLKQANEYFRELSRLIVEEQLA